MNGDGEKSSINLDGILKRLLDDGFVEPLVKSMFKSPSDTYLEAEKERESRERAKLQDILTKAGERVEADAKADMEAKIAAETKKAEAEIKAKYAKEHGASEWNDDQVVPLKNMLGSLMGGKR